MKVMVEKLYKKILKPFLDEVEVATKKESKHSYLRATEQAFIAITSIEKKREKYDLSDLDVHRYDSSVPILGQLGFLTFVSCFLVALLPSCFLSFTRILALRIMSEYDELPLKHKPTPAHTLFNIPTI